MTAERKPTCGDAGGMNANGEPCGCDWGLSESTGLCVTHDPERIEQRRQIAAIGGKARTDKLDKFEWQATLPPLRTHADARVWQEEIARAVLSGKIDRKDAGTVGKILSDWVKAREGELTIDELEKLQDAQKKIREASRNRPRVA